MLTVGKFELSLPLIPTLPLIMTMNTRESVCQALPSILPGFTYDNVGHRDAAQLAPVPAIEMFEAVDDGPDEEAAT